MTLVTPQPSTQDRNPMPTASHVERVASYFQDPNPYLSRSYNLRIRSETIREMLGDRAYGAILDLGCGDGSLSLPLLGDDTRLTLIDVTPSMLERAGSRVPEEFRPNVTTRLGDIMAMDLPAEGFDLVLCMGVLAHVESPDAVLDLIASLVRPGGLLILTVSSGVHVLGWLRKSYLAAKALITRPHHRARFLSTRQVLNRLSRHGLRIRSEFRYNFPAPGMDRMVPNDRLYANIRRRYGNLARNTRAWLGSECIFALEKVQADTPTATA
jgi:2-polyprenyl-3-methyl-5-hydroxy-6-metoxy-1,4-benzoquinol methylase